VERGKYQKPSRRKQDFTYFFVTRATSIKALRVEEDWDGTWESSEEVLTIRKGDDQGRY